MECRRLLRLLIIFLLFLVVVKLLFGSFSTDSQGPIESTSKKIEILNPGKFWPKKPFAQKEPQILKEPARQPSNISTNPKKILKSTADTLVKQVTIPLRVVHLDLKGAAPNIRYLQQIFPLISSLGANGVLMEYEDMFPYEDDLQLLRSPFAYSVQDIEEIVKLAHNNNLELIPLVQVFGHLEFVLKHEKYFKLREVADFPNSLNPQAPGSLDLIKKMLTQVLRRHPNVQRFHIGADEVYGLGGSESSKHWIQHNNGSVGSLFLNHVTQVCHFMAEQRPGIKLMFWEDMLRKISSATMKESGMTRLASPMIWKYDSNLDVTKIGELISRYQDAGFKSVWFASAFKGASGIDQRWTPLTDHLQNHLAWLKVITSMTQYPSITMDGIVLTGWQRYEHHSVLCELLPVGTPSLAICLQTLKHGLFDETVKADIHRMLGCTVEFTKNSCEGTRSFPGAVVYGMVQKINTDLQKSVDKIMQHGAIRGSFSPYHRKYSFGNPRSIGFFKNDLTKFLNEWETFLETFENEMDKIFYSDTVEEWIEENVNIYMNKVRSLAKDMEQTLKLKGQPKSLNPSYENKDV